MRRSHRRTKRPFALHISSVALTLALAFGQFGLAAAGATDRDRDGSFSSDTEVISDDDASDVGANGADSDTGGGVPTRDDDPAPQPRHGGTSVPVDFQAAAPGSYNHSTGAAGAGFGFANTVSTLNGGDFRCGDKIVFLVKVHAGDAYAGGPVTGFGYSFAKQTTGQPGAGYTSIGSPSLVTGDAAHDDDGAGASISNVSIGSTATLHTVSFDISGIDGQLAAPDAEGDAIVFRMTATLGCTPGASPTGQIQANQTGIGGNDTVNLNVTGLPIPAALAISKTVTGGGSVDVMFGQNISWTITVTNSGNANAANVNVTDTLPTGFALVSATPSQGGPCTGTTTIDCPLGTINAGASATVVIVATAASTCGPYTNTATGTLGARTAITPNNNSVNGSVTGCAPNVTRIKAVTGGGSADVGFGQSISWTITVNNSGNADATNVSITDNLPAGFTLFSATPSQGGPCTGTTTITCPLGTINAGASATVVIVATAPTTCGPYTNTASGTYGAGTAIPPATAGADQVGGNVTGCGPGLTIGKSGPASVNPGDPITWTVTVTNSGNAHAIGVQVNDTLPAGFSFVSSNPGPPTCTEAGGVVSCTVDVLAGSQTSISITATAPLACGPFTNTATLVGGGSASSNGDVSGCGGGPVVNPALAISKVADAAVVAPGDPIGFAVKVMSIGTATAHAVTLNDALPAIPGVTWAITGGSGAGSCQINSNSLTCNFGDMASPSSLSVHVTGTGSTTDSCGTFTNTATADGNDTAPVTHSATVEVDCPPGLDLVKSGPATAKVGDTITYTFDVTLAAGSPPIPDVVVTDPICDAGTLTVPAGDDGDNVLETGETWAFTCTHVVKASDPDPLPNTATACGTLPSGATVCDSDNHEVDITHPDIEVVKTADPPSGSPGNVITFTYTVTNSGDVPLFNVSVDDNVLGHICDIAVLQPKETVVCTGTYTIPANATGEITNIVIAGGTDPGGDVVEDEDDLTITIVAGTTVTPTKTPPGGVAFTGPATVIPVAALALLLLAVGSVLLWLGRRRGPSRLET